MANLFVARLLTTVTSVHDPAIGPFEVTLMTLPQDRARLLRRILLPSQ
jgi:hypothetical protein